MTVKEYLSQIYYAKLKLQRLQERREILYERMKGISSPGMGERVQTSPEDKMPKIMAKLDGIDRKIAGQIEREQMLIEKISVQVEAVEPLQYRELLALRYINCLPWAVIAERMGYTERRIYQLHGTALAIFARKHFI